jgi:hypothetical protein
MDTPDRNTRTGGAAAMRALLLAALLAPTLPALAQRALLSHAEQPAKLIRKTTVYDAPAGAGLQPGDIVESGARGLQIEWPNGALVALGPSSSVQLDSAAGAPSVNLLRGWIKVAASKPASKLTAAAGPLDVRSDGGSGILHLAADMTELFVEQGTLSATDKDKAATPPLTINREQYALRRGVLPLQLMPRAPKLFVSAMPRVFFDPLVAVAKRAKQADAVALREVEAKDVADWNDVPAILNKRLVAQFAPRLVDPAFAKDAETLLGNNTDWRQALQGAKKRNIITNFLF